MNNPAAPHPGFVSLFSGCGGLDLGLEMAGWESRYAVDSDRDAVATLEANRGRLISRSRRFATNAVIEHADVRDLGGAEILEKIGCEHGQIPLMAGGPPCQSWSSAGRQKGFDDPRGVLFRDFVRLADECGCEMIVFENVRGMLTARGPSGEPGEALQVIRQTLLDRGYASEVTLLNAADFGVPQRRVRLIIAAFRASARPIFPDPSHQSTAESDLFFRRPWRTLGQALEKLSPPTEDEIIRPNATMAARLSGLLPGQGVKSAGKRESTRPGGHWGYLQGGFVADPALPARTVTASSQQDWIRLDDGTYRRLGPRECAVIQSFPANWKFVGNRSSQYRQIGNAVPPELGKSLGMSLLAARDGTRTAHRGIGMIPLSEQLRAAIEYTKREEARNGESRRDAANRIMHARQVS